MKMNRVSMRERIRRGRLFALVVVGVFSVSALISMPATGEEAKGNAKQGKYLFRAKCKECHWPDAEGGEVTPVTYTQKQWKGFFEREKHKRKKDVSDQFNAEEILHIRTYLIEHASDSEQPETCG